MSNSLLPDVAHLTSDGRAIQSKSACRTAADLPITEPVEVRGLYVHTPFCFHKCHYCDFYSIVDRRDRQDQFVSRLIDEISAVSRRISGPIETIFVGGGTPTLLAPTLWQPLLDAINSRFELAGDLEFTVEANPETVTAELLAVLAGGGVNRLSIGAQSFDPTLLKTLERWHDPANVRRAVHRARAAGIDNINLDLIFGIPGQTLTQWHADLDAALALQPTHLSCYGLMYEPNTPMTHRLNVGEIQRADDELEAAMYTAAIDRLADAGYEHYEISNWATPANRCRHNLLYWTNANWWSLGPSGSAHVNGWRWKNVPRLGSYLDLAPLPPIEQIEHLDDDARIGETLMLRLRLLDGLTNGQLDALIGAGDNADRRRAAIASFVRDGLLVHDDAGLRLSRRGLLLADTVLAELL